MKPASTSASVGKYPDDNNRCDRNLGASASTEGRVMFARATSAAGSSSFSTSTRRASISTPFAAAFASVATTALYSVSSAITGSKPSFAATIASTPEPEP